MHIKSICSFYKKTQTKTCFLTAFNIRLALEFSARVWVITEVNYSLPEVIRLQGIHERKITIWLKKAAVSHNNKIE